MTPYLSKASYTYKAFMVLCSFTVSRNSYSEVCAIATGGQLRLQIELSETPPNCTEYTILESGDFNT